MPVTEQSRGYSERVDAGADADFEHPLARPDAHPLNRLHAARVQRRTERPVVDPRDVLVDARDEVVLDHGHRQGARRRVGPENLFAVAGAVSVQIRPSALRLYLTFRRNQLSERYRRRPGRPQSAPMWSKSAGPCTRVRSPCASLARDRHPFGAASSGRARRMRSSSASGTDVPGTSLAMNSAWRALSNGSRPATTGSPADSMRFRNARTRRRRRSAASRRTRRRPRPCTRTASTRRRDSAPRDSPTRRCETAPARRSAGRRGRSHD